ncbi:MAG: hypothetical protein H6835_17405 [Planctomycetes bacterium]|nr:hypothetical protein [Planctomycetota bacterium]
MAWAHVERFAVTATTLDWPFALGAPSDERIARVLGADMEILSFLRARLPGTCVLHQRVGGSLEELRQRYPDDRDFVAAFEGLSARNGLFLQLTALAYPQAFVIGLPEPITVAEDNAKAGHERWLLVLPGDPLPQGRPGWVAVHSSARFSVWRCPTGS